MLLIVVFVCPNYDARVARIFAGFLLEPGHVCPRYSAARAACGVPENKKHLLLSLDPNCLTTTASCTRRPPAQQRADLWQLAPTC
jgi:hypothetical protein